MQSGTWFSTWTRGSLTESPRLKWTQPPRPAGSLHKAGDDDKHTTSSPTSVSASWTGSRCGHAGHRCFHLWKSGLASACCLCLLLSPPWPPPVLSSCPTPPHFGPLFGGAVGCGVLFLPCTVFIELLRTFLLLILGLLFWDSCIRLSGHRFRVWFYGRARERASEKNTRGRILKGGKASAKGRWPCPHSALNWKLTCPRKSLTQQQWPFCQVLLFN